MRIFYSMQYKQKLGVLFSAIICLSGCGNSILDNEAASRSVELNLDRSCERYNERFNDCEIERIYTDSTSTASSSRPVQLKPILFSYPFKNAPEAVQNEWGFGYFIAGFKGFLNVGSNISGDDISGLISHLEQISGYRNLVLKNGKKVFTNSYNTDARWNKIPDGIDGEIEAGGEYFRAILNLKAKGFGVSIKSGLSLTKDDFKIAAFLKNVRPVSVSLVGTVVKVDGVRILWEFYPYRNGFLVYGASVITPEKFKDDIARGFSTEFSEAVFNWLANHVD
jgi:hypothetical protein